MAVFLVENYDEIPYENPNQVLVFGENLDVANECMIELCELAIERCPEHPKEYFNKDVHEFLAMGGLKLNDSLEIVYKGTISSALYVCYDHLMGAVALQTDKEYVVFPYALLYREKELCYLGTHSDIYIHVPPFRENLTSVHTKIYLMTKITKDFVIYDTYGNTFTDDIIDKTFKHFGTSVGDLDFWVEDKMNRLDPLTFPKRYEEVMTPMNEVMSMRDYHEFITHKCEVLSEELLYENYEYKLLRGEKHRPARYPNKQYKLPDIPVIVKGEHTPHYGDDLTTVFIIKLEKGVYKFSYHLTNYDSTNMEAVSTYISPLTEYIMIVVSHADHSHHLERFNFFSNPDVIFKYTKPEGFLEICSKAEGLQEFIRKMEEVSL